MTNDIPPNWVHKKLGEIIKLNYGKALPAKDRIVGHVPVFGSNGIIGHHNSSLITGPCIIVGRKGSIGEVHISSEPCWAIDTTYYIDDFTNCDILYTKFLLGSLPLTSMNRATAIPGLNREDVYLLDIVLPPLEEQKKIALKIDNLINKSDGVSKLLYSIPDLTERYYKALLGKAFDEKHFNKSDRTKWKRKNLGEILTGIKAGKNLRCEERPPLDNELGVVKVNSVTWGKFNPKASKTLPSNYKPNDDIKIKNGDLLFSRANTLQLVGAVVLVQNTPSNLYLSDKILRLDMEENLKSWVHWFLRSPMGRLALEKDASGTQESMRNISQNVLRSITIPLPPAKIRTSILNYIEVSMSWNDLIIQEVNCALSLLTNLNKAVIDKALQINRFSQDQKIGHRDVTSSSRNQIIPDEKTINEKRIIINPESKMHVTRNIHEVLLNAEDWMSANELFKSCGIEPNSTTEQIEPLYAQLRSLDQSGKLSVTAVRNEDGKKLYDKIKLNK